MIVNITKTNENAVIPTYSKAGDAGMDLTAVSLDYDKDGNAVYDTGLAFEIPKGYVGLLFPRSSNAKKELLLSNSVGVIDSGYRGNVIFKFKPSPQFNYNLEKSVSVAISVYGVGDRIGQIIIMPYPQIEFNEVKELESSERGTGGYGSTGK